MERRQFHPGIAIGAAIGALLAAVLFVYLLAFEPGGWDVSIETGVGIEMIGAILGAVLGWVFSRSRPAVEEVVGVPRGRGIRIVMWFAAAMAVYFAVIAGISGELVEALGWLALTGCWTLQASGAAERARLFLYLSGGALLLGILLLGTGFILGEF